MSDYDAPNLDQTLRLAELIAMLPPAPEAWVRAAQELPPTRMQLDEIVARAVADADFRKALMADLEATLERAGYEPDPPLVEAVRAKLPEL